MIQLLLLIILLLGGCGSTTHSVQILSAPRPTIVREQIIHHDGVAVESNPPESHRASVPTNIRIQDPTKLPKTEIVVPGGIVTENFSSENVSSQLYKANMVYSVPQVANIKDVIKVQLLIDPRKGLQELINSITVNGNSTGKNIKVSKIVVAKIVAPNFTVTPITAEEQILSNETTEWLWSLEPKSSGKHEVNVSITAVIEVGDKSAKHHIKTFDSTVNVVITATQLLSDWLTKYWQWLATTLLLPGIVWTWKKINSSKQKSDS
jgi:hypothetical protein